MGSRFEGLIPEELVDMRERRRSAYERKEMLKRGRPVIVERAAHVVDYSWSSERRKIKQSIVEC